MVRCGALVAVFAAVFLTNNAEAARTTNGLRSLYWLRQGDCTTGTFADESALKAFGDVSYNTVRFKPDSAKVKPYTTDPDNGKYKCPEVQVGEDLLYRRAYNGAHFSGLRQPSLSFANNEYEFLESATDATNFGVSDRITIDAWIRPVFADSNANQNYVLFEIGKSTLSSASSDWECGSGDFDAQLSYNPSAGQKKFSFVFRSSGSACQNLNGWDPTALESGKVYHVLLTYNPTSYWNLYVTEASSSSVAAPKTQNLATPVAGASWSVAHHLHIGSSPAVLSTETATLTYRSWAGDILMFALYNRELSASEIGDNFAAGLPNSGPSVAVDQVLIGEEDGSTELDVNVFDFERDVLLGSGASFELTLVSNVTDVAEIAGVVGGKLSLAKNGAELKPQDKVAGTKVWFKTTGDDGAYGGPAKFSVKVSDGEKESILAGDVRVAVSARNDAPKTVAPGKTFVNSGVVPQTQSVMLTLSGWDKDCSIAQDLLPQTLTEESSSCELYGLKEFEIVRTAKLGLLYPAEEVSTNVFKCLSINKDSTKVLKQGSKWNLTNTKTGQQDFKVCFEGCLTNSTTNPCPAGTKQSADGIVGYEDVGFFVRDLYNATVEQNITVMVTSVLQTGSEIKRHYTIREDLTVIANGGGSGYDSPTGSGFLPIQLSGLDYSCDNTTTNVVPYPLPAICADRTKSYVLKALPPAYQGFLYTAPDASKKLTALPVGGLDIVGDLIYFKPTAGYFNQDSWPLCGPGKSYTFSSCPDPNETPFEVKQFMCAGPAKVDNPKSCTQYDNKPPTGIDQFTTIKDLEGKVMGKCGGSLTEGCPVDIKYSLKVQNLQSKAEVGSRIWITNVHNTGTFNIPRTTYTEVLQTDKVPLRGNSSSGNACISIDSLGEEDSRVLSMKMTVENSRGQLFFNDTVIDRIHTLDFGPTAGSKETGASSFTLTGTRTALNQQLCFLTYQAIKSEANAIIVFEFQDLSDSRYYLNTDYGVRSIKEEATITIVFKKEEIADTGLQVTAYVVWASISAGALLILGACYCCIHCLIRRALAGERIAVWFVRNVLFTHIDPHDEHALDHEHGLEGAAKNFEDAIRAERVSMERVKCCARLLHVICPCCCKFNPGENEDLPSEENMKLAALKKINDRIASAHLPPLDELNRRSKRLEVAEDEIFDWEKHHHVDEQTGEVRSFYYNSRTNISTWSKPTVHVRKAHPPGVRDPNAPASAPLEMPNLGGNAGRQQKQRKPKVPYNPHPPTEPPPPI